MQSDKLIPCKYAENERREIANKEQFVKEKCPRSNAYHRFNGYMNHHTNINGPAMVTCNRCKIEKEFDLQNIVITIRKVTNKVKNIVISFEPNSRFYVDNYFCITIKPSNFLFITRTDDNYLSNVRDEILTKYIRERVIKKIKNKEYTLKYNIAFIEIWQILHKKWNLLPEIIILIYKFLFC